jgi:hypothetical protein
LRAVTNSLRAACLTGLLAASISGAEANPGLLFYIALAATISARRVVNVECGRRCRPAIDSLLDPQNGRLRPAAEV